MRYIDTGGRDPDHALGSWLEKALASDVTEVRWQTGYFGADSLGLFVPTFDRLKASSGVVRVLVGSNEGLTSRVDVQTLLTLAGAPRPGAEVGVVSFEDGFFHPKVVHLTRQDGSAAAYVGSANITTSGMASLHIEAGLIVDTRDGDALPVLRSIAGAVDAWFGGSHDGLYLVSRPADLDQLVMDGILDVPRPPRPQRPPPSSTAPQQTPIPKAKLRKLFSLPSIKRVTGTAATPQPAAASPGATAGVTAGWQVVWRSNALSQRDLNIPTGTNTNPTGSMALKRGDWNMTDHRHFFRDDVFADLDWYQNPRAGRKHMELAEAEVEVVTLGVSRGSVTMTISHNTDTTLTTYKQNNAMTHLRWGAASAWVSQQALLDEVLELDREVQPATGAPPRFRIRIG